MLATAAHAIAQIITNAAHIIAFSVQIILPPPM